MATPSEKLADSLTHLKSLQEKGVIAIKSSMLSRTHRERLIKGSFLNEVYKGWYIAMSPHSVIGESAAWYNNYWEFCSQNLNDRFGNDWCATPEQSILLYAGNTNVPNQLVIRSSKAVSQIVNFLYDTSLVIIKASIPKEDAIVVIKGIRAYSLLYALVNCTQTIFKNNPVDMRTALSAVSNASEILAILLEGGHSAIAGRLAGAFRNIGKDSIAMDIVETMKKAGYDTRETDPFEFKVQTLSYQRPRSPYEARIRFMWQDMREKIIPHFPDTPGLPSNSKDYIQTVKDIYVTDAYHSLSIERYEVTPELIEKVRSGTWDSIQNEDDKKQRNAMAAKGYWDAFQVVQKSFISILSGENPGSVIENDHSIWYREMFGPSVAAGICKASDLAGYRNRQVFISGSRHTPPNYEAVRDTMPVFFELVHQESEACVRAVLGHFIFVYIHPYSDGNGRMGRFIMNALLASGGFPWTVIPVKHRERYMASLEQASVKGEIEPFAKYIAHLVTEGLKGTPVAKME